VPHLTAGGLAFHVKREPRAEHGSEEQQPSPLPQRRPLAALGQPRVAGGTT